MEMTKLTIRIPVKVLEQAKAYAETNETSVTQLITQYLYHLPRQESYLKDAPIVQRLVGTLPPEASIEDYHRYLEEKYGDAFTSADRS